MDFGSLTDRRAVVTGSSSGIGRAIALEFAHAGADVIVHCRRSLEAADALAAEMIDLDRKAHVLAADLGEPDALEEFASQAWDVWGGVDVWVNNAGVDLLTGAGAELEYPEKLQRLLDVDVRSTILLSRLIGRRMRDAGGGVLINVGWDQAAAGMGGDSGELFSAAKNAVMGFTCSAAVSLAPEVRVNCIAPGWIRTAWGDQTSEAWHRRVLDETPLDRWGRPEDVAAVARFLASDNAAYITGQVWNVNGGAVR